MAARSPRVGAGSDTRWAGSRSGSPVGRDDGSARSGPPHATMKKPFCEGEEPCNAHASRSRPTTADGPARRVIDRRTVLAGAAGAIIGPSRAKARVATPASPAPEGFDSALARRLQQVLDDTVAASNGSIPGALLHVARAGDSSWVGAAGFAQLDPTVAMRPGDRFGADSIVKMFVTATPAAA
jgi:hypothetical protein